MVHKATYTSEETENCIKCSMSVNTTNILDFCRSIDNQKITNEIYNFVSKKLAEYEVKQNIDKCDIGEMVKNSCDSFVSKASIDIGTNLEILVKIKRRNDAVVVTFKDNGKGLDMPGKIFDVTGIVKQSWSSRSYRFFGGNHLGLKQMNAFIKEQGGAMQLKKRKNGGCTVSVIFDSNKASNPTANNQADANEQQSQWGQIRV